MKYLINLFLLFSIIHKLYSIPFDDRLFGADIKFELDGSENYITVDGNGTSEEQMTIYRLPDNFEPLHYTVHIEPHLKKAVFDGYVKITFKVTSHTKKLILNSKYLNYNLSDPNAIKITKINSAAKQTRQMPIDNIHLDTINEQIVIKTKTALVNSKNDIYVVEIKYTGMLAKDMMGFYLSKYVNNGTEKLLGTTQFEPTGARRAFPSFDEPAYKTPFIIKITRENYQTSISNMKLIYSEPINGTTKVLDTFGESPLMSTYLVGFAVFEFDKVSNENETMRVWGRENVIKEQGTYILVQSQKIMSALSEYMGIDYYKIMPKMDLVAVPDFDAGAMENWGMNTYREIWLLSDLKKTKFARIEELISTVTHEFSHQWFGDLVTPKWWNYVWLNEAFATYFEHFGTAWVEPEWRMEDLFVIEQVQVAFNDDLAKSHPITADTTDPDSIALIFDRITYNKGGSVLRMLENVMSPDLFRDGLRNYVASNAFGSVEPSNLWDSLDTVIDDSNHTVLPPSFSHGILQFMDEWINKPGFPLVHVERDYNLKVANFSQKRFFTKESDSINETDTKWNIPITYTQKTGSNFNPRENIVWLKKNNSLSVKVDRNEDWLIVNIKETGFYRVNYDSENWKMIASQLSINHKAINVINRAQILDDAFTLARVGTVSYQVALDLTQYLQNEIDFIPWYSFFSHIRYLTHTYAAHSELSQQIKEYFQTQLIGIYTDLGFDDSANEENMRKIGRSKVALWMCNWDNSQCVNATVTMFQKWIRRNSKAGISPNMKDAVYCMGIKHGSADDWVKLWNHYTKSELASEKITILYALGCSVDEDILYNYLIKITNETSEIRRQDHYIVIRSVLGEKAGIKAGMKFITNHARQLINISASDDTSTALDNLKSIISTTGAGISDGSQLKEFTNILSPFTNETNIASTINRTITHIEERINYKDKNEAILKNWFSKNIVTTPATPVTSNTKGPEPNTTPHHHDETTTTKPNSATNIQCNIVISLLLTMIYFIKV